VKILAEEFINADAGVELACMVCVLYIQFHSNSFC